ncbi:sialidase family protein [Candidatus Uabimicrobium amorphum]|uniref:Sialidase domain-containing protein n=1 Tax=Uabimicrobium amorphum TaxID=2596890 RepID=A0A5S9IKW0_UABAM|nr:sialidase family protein [Candidatus Uabimicrobium amorphum]BBM83748.1 hypothetical protein UABAM_02102 [Candidatus Uabimicrobium amorphum]
MIAKTCIYETTDFCHAPTIVEYKPNQLACAWFAGKYEGHRESVIYFARHQNWSCRTAVISAQQTQKTPCWNPVLFSYNENILLFYKLGIMPSRWRGALTTSSDEGQNWSCPQNLPIGYIGPVKNKPLLLEKDIIMCGSSIESPAWQVHMEFFAKNSWRKTPPINETSLFLIQPTIVQCSSGKILALFRSGHGFIYASHSNDRGESWSSPTPTPLPNPNSGIDAVCLDNGKIVIVYNHSQQHRFPLNIAVSDDEGISWKTILQLEHEPHKVGYSYPSIIQSADKKIHIVYSWKCQKINYAVLDPSSLNFE